MYSLKEQERERIERLRGWIIYILFKQRPKAMDLTHLRTVLDKRNFPLSRRTLAGEIDYLGSLRLLKVFPSGADEELGEAAQTRLIQRFADCESDEEMGQVLCARITAAGINFQEGRNDMDGVHRVE